MAGDDVRAQRRSDLALCLGEGKDLRVGRASEFARYVKPPPIPAGRRGSRSPEPAPRGLNAAYALDLAVAAAYDWLGLNLDHAFYETKHGVRFTISEAARQEVLARLLRLNHERYQDEVRRGLHDKKKRRAPSDTEETTDDLFVSSAEDTEP